MHLCGRPYAEHGGPPPHSELVDFSRLFLSISGSLQPNGDTIVPPSPGAAAALVRVIWDTLPLSVPSQPASVSVERRRVSEAIIGVKLLLCLSRAWFASDAGPGLPEWLGDWIPQLIAHIVCCEGAIAQGRPGARIRGILTCAALELGIGLLSVEHYRLPLQKAFQAVLAHRTAAPDFFEQLRRRLKRAELEDAALGNLYKQMMQGQLGKGTAAVPPEFLFLDRAGCKRSLAAHELAASAGRDDAHALGEEEARSNHVELVLGFTQVCFYNQPADVKN